MQTRPPTSYPRSHKMEQLTDEHLPEDIDVARHGNPELEAALERSDSRRVEEIQATLDIIREAYEHLEELLQIGRPQS